MPGRGGRLRVVARQHGDDRYRRAGPRVFDPHGSLPSSLAGYRRGCSGKVFLLCVLHACVRSGSRLLSGSTRTTGEFASAPLPGSGRSGVGFSRQFARVFSQKICAGTLPPLARRTNSRTPVHWPRRRRDRGPHDTACAGLRRAADDFGDVVLTDADASQMAHLFADRLIDDKRFSSHLPAPDRSRPWCSARSSND